MTNHTLSCGRKHTSEKQLVKSFKNLQRHSKKKSLEIFHMALFYAAPVFKVHKIKNKRRKKKKNYKKFKELPGFITNKNARVSSSIRNILNIKTNESKFHKQLSNEILLSAGKKSRTLFDVTEAQKRVLAKKRHLFY